jgi:uncharacterized protein
MSTLFTLTIPIHIDINSLHECNPSMFSFGKMKILTIDGGGLRGIYPAYLLLKLKELTGFDPLKHVDLLAGTSTGSIIVAGLAAGKSIEEIVKLYEVKSKLIFAGKKFSVDGMYKSKYGKDALREILVEQFGEMTMGDIKKPLFIPATDIGNGNVFVFRSHYSKAYHRDCNTKIVDAVVASCSAPTYFDPEKVQEFLLSDGGLWANNPAGVGITEAMGHFKKHRNQIRLLSLGTGSNQTYYKITGHETRKWGLMTGWEGGRMIETILGLQARSVDYMIDRVLDPRNVVRINFSRADISDLDNPNIMEELKAKAVEDVWKYVDDVKRLMVG